MKKILLALLASPFLLQAQNVGIGTSTPNASAKLEIVDANRGFLFPRVSLTDIMVAAPVAAPANWLVVFNTNTVAGATGVTPGLYYWDAATTRWVRIQSGNTPAWSTLGNAGTIPATNFIGTTDAQDLVFRTGNTEKMRLMNNGRLGVSSTNPRGRVHAEERFLNDFSTYYPLLPGVAVQDNTDFVGITTVDKDGVAGTVDDSDAIMYWGDNGNENLYFSLFQYVGGAPQMTRSDKMTIQSNGRVGIGTNTPATLLDVNGGTRTTNFQLTAAPLALGNILRSDAAGNANWATPASIITPVAWSLTGNPGTNPATNFIGTTDNVDWVARTNNVERLRILSTGNVGIGTTTPAQALHVNGDIQFRDNLHTPAIVKITPFVIRGTGYPVGTPRIADIGATALTPAGRGLTLIIVDKATHTIVSTTNYDTYGATTESDNLAMALDAMTQTQIGFLTSFDAWELNITANLRTAFRRLGLVKAANSTGTTGNNYRQPYAAVFEASTGTTTASAVEICHLGNNTITPHAELRGWLMEGGFVAGNQQPTGLVSPQGGIAASIDINNNLSVAGNGTFSGTVSASCGVLSCSDVRYKQDIRPLETALGKVTRLQPVTYVWKTKEFPEKGFDDKLQIGLIAQDLEKIYPELVHTDAQGFKTVDYPKLTPILLKAVQEQQTRADAQQKEIDMLKTELEAIKKMLKK